MRVEFGSPGILHSGAFIASVEAQEHGYIWLLDIITSKGSLSVRWDAGKNWIIDTTPEGFDKALSFEAHDRIVTAVTDAYNQRRALVTNPGYHMTKINKGVLGETSKIREELEELEDAMAQGVKIMAAVEVADLIGAIEAFINKEFPGLAWGDFDKMKTVTQRAFKNGAR